MTQKKRFAAVGTGGRLGNFTYRLVELHKDTAELVGLCDTSRIRMQAHNKELTKRGYPEVPMYAAEDFEKMLEETKPDAVFITTVDAMHHEYILKTLERGIEAITEKPMTTDAEKCQAILDKVEATQGKCRVTFNYRFINWNTKVKELLLAGTIGKVLSVNLEYLLDVSHGADYFRRWHSYMKHSGGLLVHKSTHHFDLVNWWLDSIPDQVFAYGRLAFYGKANAIARGDEALTRYPRYTGYTDKSKDPFALCLDDGGLMQNIYLDAEKDSGYIRDQNVFRDGIDIYDSMSVNVRYRCGTYLTYSLNAFSPREGMRVTFNGEKGRIEFYEFGGSHIIRGQSDEELAKEQAADKSDHRIIVYPMFDRSYQVEADPGPKGGHGGSDILLGEQIFSHDAPVEKLGRNAGHEQGAASILIGIAANQSIAENRPVNINDLVSLKPGSSKLSELI